MTIIYHRQFEKTFRRLPERIKMKAYAVIRRFAKDPHDPSLRNHPLTGQMRGLRSLSVTDDHRIIFMEQSDGSVVIMLKVGPHDSVYY